MRADPCTLRPTPYTLHPTPYALHHTPYTPHPTPHTLHPAPYTLHPTVIPNPQRGRRGQSCCKTSRTSWICTNRWIRTGNQACHHHEANTIFQTILIYSERISVFCKSIQLTCIVNSVDLHRQLSKSRDFLATIKYNNLALTLAIPWRSRCQCSSPGGA